MTDVSGEAAAPRARRMKQQDLRDVMLDAAEGLLDGRGLGVNAYPLNMEDLIRQVGVPRSSAFHAFGTKENLVYQLALRLLNPESPLATHFAAMTASTIDDVTAEFPGRASDAAGRHALMCETMRRAISRQHDLLVGSARWRTFRALSMSLDSFPPEESAVLAERLILIQHDFVGKMSRSYQLVFDTFSLRLRPGLSITHFVRAASSALEGIATARAFSSMDSVGTPALPGVDGKPVEWNLAAVAIVALIDGMTDPV